MTEDEARSWTERQFGSAATLRLETFVDLVVAENQTQNLISPASVAQIWSRHVVDSLQLMEWSRDGTWLDIGTGGGFPGLAVALVRDAPMILVEPRRKRADFLLRCVHELSLSWVAVEQRKVEQVEGKAAVITARAVASIENLLRTAWHCATSDTRWLLPRGSIDRAELTKLARERGMMFHVEQSLTQAESSVVVLTKR